MRQFPFDSGNGRESVSVGTAKATAVNGVQDTPTAVFCGDWFSALQVLICPFNSGGPH